MSRIRLLAALAALVLGIAAGIVPAFAEVRIDITNGQMRPLPIAVPDFAGSGVQDSVIGRDIARVISADLERSGLFKPVDPRAFIQTVDSLQIQPRFPDWKAINAEALVQGRVELTADGRLRVEFRLWDVFSETYMTGLAFNALPVDWRRLSHKVADAIYKRVTGEDGYFDTQIVYVAETGPKNARIRRLAIMDQDGENHRFLSDPSEMVLTPRFSPNTREITYLSYFRNTPRVYVFNLDTGRREELGKFGGMTYSPTFSPDGNTIAFSLAEGGNTEIYTMNLMTRQRVRLTTNPAIDTSPSYSPDGTKIAFESDRGGSQQLYIMGADGSNPTRISFGDGRYATPVWSPRGDLIAFTKQKGGQFYIGVMRTDGSGERLLAEGFLVEGPTWAPNGRVLAFWRQVASDHSGRGHSVRLYSIDLTGTNERQLVTPVDGSDPAWSPLIP